jgi:hypothetical protein
LMSETWRKFGEREKKLLQLFRCRQIEVENAFREPFFVITYGQNKLNKT